ncbi:putative BET1-like protein [Helianthus annuus]|nr:putative BET1-like protein [Helianthus annuus]KAJ0596564.1 putative BET1-like protein [Helianthus annuus]KAJ0757226.1 putative BET1-like protein [Helianthus annuus]KAJ0760948.1 putative BET1-like protein [Helianthus annuus]
MELPCRIETFSLIGSCLQQMTLIKAQAGVKNNMRRLNKSIVQSGSSHVLHVVLFALFCLFLVYLWSKFSRR